MADDYALRNALAKLKKIHEATGSPGGEKQVTEALGLTGVDPMEVLSKEEKQRYDDMPRFDQAQYRTALELQHFRAQLARLEEMEETNRNVSTGITIFLGSGGKLPFNRTDLGRVTNDLRKRNGKLNSMANEIKREAQFAGKPDVAKEIVHHVEKTRELYKRKFAYQGKGSGLQFSPAEGSSDADVGDVPMKTPTKGGSERAPLLDADFVEGGGGTEIRASLRDDEDFQSFFQQVACKDQKIDQAIDRIYQGTLRVKDTALGIQENLKVQDQLLDDAEGKVDVIETKLKTLNKKLKDTLNKVDKDKMCIYLLCCLLLFGILGYILYEMGVFKN